ncbi:hypothetical protein FHG87_002319 [Trinorchestia longiramus]|nr:hypothetical protein FHG87_002319 [Trinorchestia longiramus]
MKPTKLREHQEKRHPQSVQYGLAVMKQKERFHTSRTLLKHGFAGTQKPMLEASYKVAYLIAKRKKPHNWSNIDQIMCSEDGGTGRSPPCYCYALYSASTCPGCKDTPQVISTAIQEVNFIRARATHLSSLRVLQQNVWVRNLFTVNLDNVDEDLTKDDLIDLRHKELLKSQLYTTEMGEFWCSMIEPYLLLAKRALQSILPYVTIYLCEAGFLILAAIRTKSRNRLDAEDDIRVALSKKSLQFHSLVNKKQQ